MPNSEDCKGFEAAEETHEQMETSASNYGRTSETRQYVLAS